MPWFKIYTGLSGGFGGAHYDGTYEYNDIEEALEDAYQRAVDEYESYGGHHGLMSWDECREDLEESFGYAPTDDDVDLHYREEVESWISYYVLPATGPDDTDD